MKKIKNKSSQYLNKQHQKLNIIYFSVQQSNPNKISGYIESQSFIIKITKPKQYYPQLNRQLLHLKTQIQQNKKLFQGLFNKNQWYISHYQLDNNITKKILVHIHETVKLQNLYIQSYSSLSLLMMSHIKYSQLLILQINSPLITLEPLTYLQAPLLRNLMIYSHVNDLQALTKTKFNNLNRLMILIIKNQQHENNSNLMDHRFNKIEIFNRIKLPKKCSVTLSDYAIRKRTNIDDIRIISKLESNLFDYQLFIKLSLQKLYIVQNQAYHKLKDRYKQRVMIDASSDESDK